MSDIKFQVRDRAWMNKWGLVVLLKDAYRHIVGIRGQTQVPFSFHHWWSVDHQKTFMKKLPHEVDLEACRAHWRWVKRFFTDRVICKKWNALSIHDYNALLGYIFQVDIITLILHISQYSNLKVTYLTTWCGCDVQLEAVLKITSGRVHINSPWIDEQRLLQSTGYTGRL